ncbi:MAG TPA: peptidase T [Gemmataceae bacterium]|nr:peptidase T [Gemmataceae bacterium]
MNAPLERFCRYVRIDTQADETAATYPSSPGQLALGRLLAEELSALGLSDAAQDEHGLVMATLPATVRHNVPAIAWIAHVDTSPETSGRDVRPIVHRDYRGGDIHLPGDSTKVIRTAENPELADLIGKTLITTDGTTLLGADDKAGVAVIMEAVAFLLAHQELRHGPIRICFTCDEEIGHGVDHIDLQKLAAIVGYTLDGAGVGQIDVETFSADLATVRIRGVNLHPSIAKGKMINAVRLAGMFIERLPRNRLTPETTEGTEGFVHPYRIDGGVAETTMRIILRDFRTSELANQADLLRSIGQSLEKEFPGAGVEVAITPQYRNMAEGLVREPRAAAFAEEAMRRAGIAPSCTSVRGGTDGSRLTELGLPTPNLSTGEHNPHSPLEWTCLEEMQTAVKVLSELAQVWALASVDA